MLFAYLMKLFMRLVYHFLFANFEFKLEFNSLLFISNQFHAERHKSMYLVLLI